MGKFSVYNWRQNFLNEESTSPPIKKKLKDITWSDVEGLSVPTGMFNFNIRMDDRPIFDDKWREETLNDWKQRLKKAFPNANTDEFDILINRNEPEWFNRVKIENPEYEKFIKRQEQKSLGDKFK